VTELIGQLLKEVGDPDQIKKLDFLLRISGEVDIPDKVLFPGVRSEYVRQRNWNLCWITLWLYGTTPAVAILIYLVAKAG
jgi:hypothetical protein